jgi:membrane protease YdiL (CAAX protease family)
VIGGSAVIVVANHLYSHWPSAIGTVGSSQGDATPEGLARMLQIALVVPIVEEFFFRGFLFSALRTRMRPWTAIIGSSLVFGLEHAALGRPLAMVPPLILAGVVLALMYERTTSLLPGIATHMTWNGAPFILVLVLAVIVTRLANRPRQGLRDRAAVLPRARDIPHSPAYGSTVDPTSLRN